MTADQFAYWLQGFTELHGEPPTPAQWEMIKDHLALVFNKVTPVRLPVIRIDDLPRQPSDASPVWPDRPYEPWKLEPGVPGPMVTTCSAGGCADPNIRMIC